MRKRAQDPHSFRGNVGQPGLQHLEERWRRNQKETSEVDDEKKERTLTAHNTKKGRRLFLLSDNGAIFF